MGPKDQREMTPAERYAAARERRARMKAGERIGCGDEAFPVGSEENPLAVMQHGYFGCQHGIRTPKPEKGDWYRVTVFLDSAGDCPACKERKAAGKQAAS
jgi:hypothetical protein